MRMAKSRPDNEPDRLLSKSFMEGLCLASTRLVRVAAAAAHVAVAAADKVERRRHDLEEIFEPN